MPLIDFKTMFSKDFRDPHFAAMYLEESLNLDIPTFLLALRDITEANCGAVEASAHRAPLTECGIAEFQALQAALDSVGMRFSFVPIVPAEAQIATLEKAKAA